MNFTPSNHSYVPHPLLTNGKLHTMIAHSLPRKERVPQHTTHKVELRDGDALFIDEDIHRNKLPANSPILLMMHGLGGSSESSYLLGITDKLKTKKIRVIRANLRGCGRHGRLKSKGIYHSGRAEDFIDTLKFLSKTYPKAPIRCCGFSLSGNILLLAMGKYNHEFSQLAQVERCFAACPPIDLEIASEALRKRRNKIFDLYYLNRLLREVRLRSEHIDSLTPDSSLNKFSKLWDFDELYTAPKAGFNGREEYYAKCSALPHLSAITAPVEVLVSLDDPVIPKKIWNNISEITSLNLTRTRHGGHLGFVSKSRGKFGDHRWLESQVFQWATQDF